MKKIVVDAYKLKRITSRMAKDFGTIPKDYEDLYSFLLLPMESNLLKLHQKNPLSNDQHAIEAIQMSLLTIDGYIKDIEYDYTRFIKEENKGFLHGLLMSFYPYTNPEIHDTIMNEDNTFDARKYFSDPIKCLLKIEKSIKLWTKEFGKTGYFKFIEHQMEESINDDEKTEYTVILNEKMLIN